MLSLRGVGYSYSDTGRPALDNVSFDVRQGEWIALVGSNGSGKSTLAKHLNALLVPMQGACFISGLDTRDEKELWNVRKTVSMVFQNPENQIVSTVVEDDVAFGPENLGLSPQEIRARVDNGITILKSRGSEGVECPFESIEIRTLSTTAHASDYVPADMSEEPEVIPTEVEEEVVSTEEPAVEEVTETVAAEDVTEETVAEQEAVPTEPQDEIVSNEEPLHDH